MTVEELWDSERKVLQAPSTHHLQSSRRYCSLYAELYCLYITIIALVISLLVVLSNNNDNTDKYVINKVIIQPSDLTTQNVLDSFVPYETRQERVSRCVDYYAKDIESVVSKDYAHNVRRHFKKELHKDQRSNKRMILAVGPGTTGTRTLRTVMRDKLHYHVCHMCFQKKNKNLGQDHPTRYLPQNDTMAPDYEEFRKWDDYNFVYNDSGSVIEFMSDTPIQEFFLDYFWTYPNARYILTTRNGRQWCESRMNHTLASFPILRPCGMTLHNPELDCKRAAKALHIYNELVRCVVPPENLLDICLLSGKVTYGDIVSFLGVRGLGIKSGELIEGSDYGDITKC